MKHRFFAYLTGENEDPALVDLLLPISSYSLRRTETIISLSITVQGFDLAADIAERPAGEVVLEWYGDNSLAEEMARATIETVTPNEGYASKSISILAQVDSPIWTVPEDDIVISKVSYRAPNGSGGKYAYQVPVPYQSLIPGATVVYGDHSFTLGDAQFEMSCGNAGAVNFACYLKESS